MHSPYFSDIFYNVPMLSSQAVLIKVISVLLGRHDNLKGIKETISDTGSYGGLLERILMVFYI